MKARERYNLEFKRQISKTFLKTVSAFANYNDGEIIFGLADDGDLIGVEEVKDQCLRIENMINDSIEPLPDFNIERETIQGREIIRLKVIKGKDTPYYYKGKAYKRSDTATLEVDRFELRRLAIEGINMNYEEKRSPLQNLHFNELELKLREKIGIDKMTLDILKTLNLYSKEGYYNLAAQLLADKNDMEFSGLDIVRFGKNPNQILYRETINKTSLLSQYDRAVEIFQQYYQYEEIEGYTRIKRELISKEAFREALANAIVHRVWDVNAFIQISMYKDRIEINSPGGLPDGISKGEYLYGNISVLRNPVIAGVFYRLDIIEKFGTGIARVNREYAHSIYKPSFNITENNINIILPVMEEDTKDLAKEEVAIYNILRDELELSRKEIDKRTGFNKTKSLRVINNLIDKNIVVKLGQGPTTSYRLK